jgi:hypothetical protein
MTERRSASASSKQQTVFQSEEKVVKAQTCTEKSENRLQFLGGSDARVIISSDEAALIRLWKEKRGVAEPEDLSGDLIVQLGVATEAQNRSCYEHNSGWTVTDVQPWFQHPVHRFLAAILDGFVNVFEAKFTLSSRADRLGSRRPAARNLLRFLDQGSRRRTPTPPPFTAINVTPADSKAVTNRQVIGCGQSGRPFAP